MSSTDQNAQLVETTTHSHPLMLQPMHLPDLPPWFPLAWGWWISLAAVVFGLILVWWLISWNVRRLAPKKAALKLIRLGKKPADAIELLRQAVLCYYPRDEVAQLTGKQWYEFLDNQIKSPLFLQNYELWQDALYKNQPVANADELIAHCSQWVDEALPPRKRRARVG